MSVGPAPCLLCGGTAKAPAFPHALPWVVRCPGCGLVCASPQPSDEELAAVYDEHYYEQFGFVDTADAAAQDGLARTKRATYAHVLAAAEPFVASGGKRLLDVGCGLGYSLLEATARGWDARGIDPLAPEDAEKRPGRTVLRGTLDSHRPETPYDVVSMIDVIEHVRDPVATLRRASELLAPGGVLAVATNDSSSLGARVLGPRWTHFHKAHLWFFTPETLRRATEKAGLAVRATEPMRRVYNLSYIASILARGDNFEGARLGARLALRVVPEGLAALPWPAVREGFVVIAQKR